MWPIILVVYRHQAFEFFKPVEDDVDLAWALFFLDHQESLAVRGGVLRQAARNIRSFKQYSGLAGTERRFRLNGDNHYLVAAAIKKLCAVGRPKRPSTACLPRDQPFDVGFRAEGEGQTLNY